MPLAPCRECKGEVSDQAMTCPHCGVAQPVLRKKNPQAERRGWFVVGCVFVLPAIAVTYCVASIGGDSKSDLDGEKTTRSGYAVCTTLESMKRVVDLASDRRAYARYIADRSNGCTLLQPGLTVTIEDYAMGGYVKIRRTGDPTSAWITKQAVGIP